MAKDKIKILKEGFGHFGKVTQTEKEFNLTDKIGTFVYHGDEGTSGYCEAVIVPNIKKFIKICLAEGWDKQFGEANEDINKGIQFMKETISKYAGDKLNDTK